MDGAVLIVDDDPSVRGALRRLLEAEGYSALTAANGEEGLDVLRSRLKVGVVLLDLTMPVMSGIEMLQQKNSDAKLRHIPVLVLSAHAHHVDMPPVNGVFPKPVDAEKLLQAIDQLYTSGKMSDRWIPSFGSPPR